MYYVAVMVRTTIRLFAQCHPSLRTVVQNTDLDYDVML